MKNKIIVSVLALLLCSCSSANAANNDTATVQDAQTEQIQTVSETSEPEKNYTCDDTAKAVMEAVEFPSMVAVTKDKLDLYLPGVNLPDDADMALYLCGSGGFADEIFIVKGNDLEQSGLSEAADKRITERLQDFADYNPAESQKLDGAIKISGDGYFMYFISDDNDKCVDTAMKMLS